MFSLILILNIIALFFVSRSLKRAKAEKKRYIIIEDKYYAERTKEEVKYFLAHSSGDLRRRVEEHKTRMGVVMSLLVALSILSAIIMFISVAGLRERDNAIIEASQIVEATRNAEGGLDTPLHKTYRDKKLYEAQKELIKKRISRSNSRYLFKMSWGTFWMEE